MSAAEFLAEQLETRYGTTTTWALHILDEFKAAGYAVVELPKSDGQDDDGQEYFGDFGIRVDHTGRGTRYPRIYISGRPSDPEAARREAADLLAAADAAEAAL